IAGPTAPFGRRAFNGPPQSRRYQKNLNGTYGSAQHRTLIILITWCPLTGAAGGSLARAHWAIWAATLWGRRLNCLGLVTLQTYRAVPVLFTTVFLKKVYTLRAARFPAPSSSDSNNKTGKTLT